MPTLTRWFLKAALVYLIHALSIGILLVLLNRATVAGTFPAILTQGRENCIV